LDRSLRDLVDTRGALSDGSVGAVNSSGPSSTWLEALTETQLEVGESSIRSAAIPKRRVNLRVCLSSNGRAEQPPARLLQREARAHDLRRLLASPRENVREREHAGLGTQ
jgi:hypothetical protein